MNASGVRTLIIDNYDSFTFNLYQLIGRVNGEEPVVVRNDQFTWAELSGLAFDNIVISPGPGTPARREDFGICAEAILHAQTPLLGVCLGHQGLGLAYGAELQHAPEPVHGRLSAITHDGSRLFAGIPQGFHVVRYHSLTLSPDLPSRLRPTAWTADGILMALAHREFPRFGIQFHPESICSEYGDLLLKNFRDMTPRPRRVSFAAAARRTTVVPHPSARRRTSPAHKVHSRKIAFNPAGAARAFEVLYGAETHAFWLDSSRAEPGLSRFSFMGAASAVVTYDYRTREVDVNRPGHRHTTRQNIYDYLSDELARRRCASDDLPFDFNGGFVGYFGYELKAGTGAGGNHHFPHPDAAFLMADRFIAFDHEQSAAWLISDGDPGDAEAWIENTAARLLHLPPEKEHAPPEPENLTFRLARDRDAYLAAIARCQQYIRDGESYEICLTNRIHTSPIRDPLRFYLTLRRANPAPYSAFLRFGELTILSGSPERFLHIDRTGVVESKPIKGTRPRGHTPEEDDDLRRDLAENEKDRSENLMIVDLLRNDLGLVCEMGSVNVPKLMSVETYETVHQLVSTVRGWLRPGIDAVGCVRAAFPGGSMTGAPKLRTMNLLDNLEPGPRGIYSGALGFLAFNGTADLSIVIRTLVSTPAETTIGIGGAIVALSDPAAEFEETLAKARALIHAMVWHANGAADTAAVDRILDTLRNSPQSAN